MLVSPVRIDAAYTLPEDPPEDFEALEQIITQEIPSALSAASCGFVRAQDLVQDAPGMGFISAVTGVPGRDSEPLGNLLSGMARRTEFTYAGSATGLATACDRETPLVTRRQWGNLTSREPSEYTDQIFDNPLFDDPPCDDYPDAAGYQSVKECERFCEYVNTFTYEDCQAFEKRDDQWVCTHVGDKYTCSEEWATTFEQAREIPPPPPPEEESPDESQPEEQPQEEGPVLEENTSGEASRPGWFASLLAQLPGFSPAPANLSQQRPSGMVPSCIICTGEECRCPVGGCVTLSAREERMNSAESPLPARKAKTFPSFHRTYTARAERRSVADIVLPGGQDPEQGTDRLSDISIPVACYGFYEEFDTQTKTLADRDFTCVITLPYSKEELQTSQRLAGDAATGPLPFDPEADVTDVTEGIDDGDEGWHNVIGGMSFLLEPAEGPADIQARLSPDEVSVRATFQHSPQQPIRRSNFQRDTDHLVTNQTADARPFIEWLHALSNDMLRLLSPPVVRMRIPAQWLPAPRSSPEASEVGYDPRTSPVDIQLRAGDDIPGRLLATLGRFYTLQEERVPVVIPLGSVREFRAQALAWRTYAKRMTLAGRDYPSEVFLIAEKLDEYANRIDQYRAMRAQLTNTVTAVLIQNGNELGSLSQWLEQSMEDYRAFEERRRERLALFPLVRETQMEITRYGDEVNQPWCRNELFTLPIAALRYPWYRWMPGEVPAMSCNPDDANALPLLCVPPERNFLFDLTLLPGRDRRDPLVIPVPHPIQVALNIPAPPDIAAAPPDAETLMLPDLPPVPVFPQPNQLVAANDAEDESDDPDPLGLPSEPVSVERVTRSLEKARDLLRSRNETYADYWRSLTRATLGGEALAPVAGKSYTDDQFICTAWNSFPCIHAEPDLRERITSITAMPGVFLTEHFDARGASRAHDPRAVYGEAHMVSCDPLDHQCQPVHNELYRTDARAAATEQHENAPDLLDPQELRDAMRGLTLTDDGKIQNGSTDTPYPHRGRPEDLYPVFHIPPDIDLSPIEPE